MLVSSRYGLIRSSSAARVCSKVIGGAPSGMSNWGKMPAFASGSAGLETFANELSHGFAQRDAFHASKRADDLGNIVGQIDGGPHHDDYTSRHQCGQLLFPGTVNSTTTFCFQVR